MHCMSSPRCEHHWFYDFRVNRRRYRQTTETANKQLAKSIEAKERARVLEGRHGIRQQPDITFKAFAEIYIRDHAELHKRSVEREILKVLNRAFGSLVLHEITAHQIEQHSAQARCLDCGPGWAEVGQYGFGGRWKSWWTARGSNSRPPHCERGALPTELAAHTHEISV
jgi:hypothetical protein